MNTTDTKKAYGNFMKQTGFDTTNKVPTMSAAPALSQGSTAGKFASHYDRSNPEYAPLVPGQLGMMDSPSGKVTPNKGLVPGHMPVTAQVNPLFTGQDNPYPTRDLLSKTPFTAVEPQRKQDWRAVGVGPETDRRGPGNVASSSPNQGRLAPSFTGTFKDIAVGEEAPFPEKPSRFSSGGGGSFGSRLSTKVESMVAGNCLVGVYILGAAFIICTGMWINTKSENGAAWAIGALMCAAGAVWLKLKDRQEQEEESMQAEREEMRANTAERQTGESKRLASANQYSAHPQAQKLDTSERQVYQPRGSGERDANPYPKPLDSQTSIETRLSAQGGLNQSNIEGPRADYWYKRGPTPANRMRVKDKDLMRSAKQVNMDARELDEYMARLDGEAPDQFVQAHPYMPLSAYWEDRQKVDDMETVHGVSSEPGAFNRKWAYRTPKSQQAGSKTMHTKSPPPGSGQAISKVHPWQEPENNVYGQPFDTDELTEYMSGHGGHGGHGGHSGGDPSLSGNLYETKVGSADAGRVAASRQQEDAYLRDLHGTQDKNPDDLPPGLQPIRTSREGLAEQMQENRQRAATQMHNQANRQDKYMRHAQGYGQTVLPPHPSDPRIAQPVQYRNAPQQAMRQRRPNQMPAPNLRQAPMRDAVSTNPRVPVSAKADAASIFEAAFVDTNAADDDAIAAETSGGGGRGSGSRDRWSKGVQWVSKF